MPSSAPPFKGTATGIFLVIFVVSLLPYIVADRLSKPYEKWIDLVLTMSFAAAAGSAFGQEKPPFKRLMYAVFFCVVISSIDAFEYGQPDLDPDDPSVVISEGFKTTFDSKAGVAVGCFLKVLAGATVGICTSELLKKIEKD